MDHLVEQVVVPQHVRSRALCHDLASGKQECILDSLTLQFDAAADAAARCADMTWVSCKPAPIGILLERRADLQCHRCLSFVSLRTYPALLVRHEDLCLQQVLSYCPRAPAPGIQQAT